MSHKQPETSPPPATDASSSIFEEGLPMISNNSLISVSYLPDPVKIEVRGAIIGNEEKRNPIIDCLIEKESGGDPKAYNPRDTDGFPKIGLLQFHIPTFQSFCVLGYGLKNDIWSPLIQIQCAEFMIKDNYGWHWGTWKRCLTIK